MHVGQEHIDGVFRADGGDGVWIRQFTLSHVTKLLLLLLPLLLAQSNSFGKFVCFLRLGKIEFKNLRFVRLQANKMTR